MVFLFYLVNDKRNMLLLLLFLHNYMRPCIKYQLDLNLSQLGSNDVVQL
jgi:hypothetical protein